MLVDIFFFSFCIRLRNQVKLGIVNGDGIETRKRALAVLVIPIVLFAISLFYNTLVIQINYLTYFVVTANVLLILANLHFHSRVANDAHSRLGTCHTVLT